MDDFERAWRKQLAAEKKYIDERSRRSDSRLNRFLQTKVPEKLKDTLDTGFAKAFELIFAKGTGVIEKTYNRRDIERSSRVRRSSTTTRACAGVRVVCRRWPVCEQSWKLVRFFHL